MYGIIQEHGGEVGVESQPGRGTTLTVELPALSGAALDFSAEEIGGPLRTRPREPEVISSSSPSFTAMPALRAGSHAEHILVVEDEPTVAELIADVLTEEGYRVDTLLDSRGALDLIEERSYDLVICDLKMPHLDGPSLYRALVKTGSPLQHRLLFVTGDTMSPRTTEFLKASGLPYLAKPFLVEELKEAVRRAVAGARGSGDVTAESEVPQVAARGK